MKASVERRQAVILRSCWPSPQCFVRQYCAGKGQASRTEDGAKRLSSASTLKPLIKFARKSGTSVAEQTHQLAKFGLEVVEIGKRNIDQIPCTAIDIPATVRINSIPQSNSLNGAWWGVSS